VQADRARFALIVGFCVTCAACGKEGANASDALGGASGGATGGAPASSDLPLLLYDRDDDDPTNDFGDNRPTVITHHGDSLYWVELASEGPRIMRAPKDGSAQPRKLGTRSTFDVAEISASARYVFWQDNGTMVAYELQTGTRRDIGKLIDDGYGGPSLAVGNDWAAFADSSCRGVATVNLETWEVTNAKIHADLRGGVTALAAIDSTVYCANGPEIIRVDLGESEAARVWEWKPNASNELPKAVYTMAAGLGKLIFRLSRTNKGASVRWSSLQVLDPADPPATLLREFDGASSVSFGLSAEQGVVFFGESHHLEGVSALELSQPDASPRRLHGEAFLQAPLAVDDRFIYWTESAAPNDRPNAKNAIYRQKKPK